MLVIGKRIALVAAAMIAMTVGYIAPAAAQATRTWVSGVGDDANPCSRTAPCKTFAGAISKTAASGEINCLDPGGWGAVTIVKAITIDCSQFPGGILNSGTNGIIVNAGATDVVIIRGLEINGAPVTNPGLNGIRFIAGGMLIVEDVVIRGMNSSSGSGILFAPSGFSQLKVSNTSIMNNGSGSTGAGILIQPAGTGSAAVVLDSVEIDQLAGVGAGVKIDTTANTGTGVTLSIAKSSISGAQGGIISVTPAGAAPASVSIDGSSVAGNTIGILGNGAGTTIRVSNTKIFGNTTGVLAAGSSTIKSYGDNLLDGNTSPGAFTAPNLSKN